MPDNRRTPHAAPPPRPGSRARRFRRRFYGSLLGLVAVVTAVGSIPVYQRFVWKNAIEPFQSWELEFRNTAGEAWVFRRDGGQLSGSGPNGEHLEGWLHSPRMFVPSQDSLVSAEVALFQESFSFQLMKKAETHHGQALPAQSGVGEFSVITQTPIEILSGRSPQMTLTPSNALWSLRMTLRSETGEPQESLWVRPSPQHEVTFRSPPTFLQTSMGGSGFTPLRNPPEGLIPDIAPFNPPQ